MEADRYSQKDALLKPLLLEWEAEDILTPVSMIQFINIDDNHQHILSIIKNNPYSSYPVYKDGVDNILGILYKEDLLDIDIHNTDLSSILHYPLFISENKNLLEIIKEFNKKQVYLSIVVDEHGSVRGMITKQNILDFLWEDEEDEELIEEKIIDNQSYFLVDPTIPLEEFNKKFNSELVCEDCDSIGGYVIEQFTYVPALDEELCIENLQIIISKTEGAKLLELKISFLDKQ